MYNIGTLSRIKIDMITVIEQLQSIQKIEPSHPYFQDWSQLRMLLQKPFLALFVAWHDVPPGLSKAVAWTWKQGNHWSRGKKARTSKIKTGIAQRDNFRWRKKKNSLGAFFNSSFCTVRGSLIKVQSFTPHIQQVRKLQMDMVLVKRGQ